MGGPWWMNGPVFQQKRRPIPPMPCTLGAPGCGPLGAAGAPEASGTTEVTAEEAEGDKQKDVWLWTGPICM